MNPPHDPWVAAAIILGSLAALGVGYSLIFGPPLHERFPSFRRRLLGERLKDWDPQSQMAPVVEVIECPVVPVDSETGAMILANSWVWQRETGDGACNQRFNEQMLTFWFLRADGTWLPICADDLALAKPGEPEALRYHRRGWLTRAQRFFLETWGPSGYYSCPKRWFDEAQWPSDDQLRAIFGRQPEQTPA